jgi:hypothetical protein
VSKLERDIAQGQAEAEAFVDDDGEQYTPLSPREQAWVCSSVTNRERAEKAEAERDAEREKRAELVEAGRSFLDAVREGLQSGEYPVDLDAEFEAVLTDPNDTQPERHAGEGELANAQRGHHD